MSSKFITCGPTCCLMLSGSYPMGGYNWGLKTHSFLISNVIINFIFSSLISNYFNRLFVSIVLAVVVVVFLLFEAFEWKVLSTICQVKHLEISSNHCNLLLISIDFTTLLITVQYYELLLFFFCFLLLNYHWTILSINI